MDETGRFFFNVRLVRSARRVVFAFKKWHHLVASTETAHINCRQIEGQPLFEHT
jgi:hypothetical protein